MDALKSDSFETTQRNAALQPRRAYNQKPDVILSDEGFHWLNTRLQNAFDDHGIIPRHDLRRLGPPELPVTAPQTP